MLFWAGKSVKRRLITTRSKYFMLPQEAIYYARLIYDGIEPESRRSGPAGVKWAFAQIQTLAQDAGGLRAIFDEDGARSDGEIEAWFALQQLSVYEKAIDARCAALKSRQSVPDEAAIDRNVSQSRLYLAAIADLLGVESIPSYKKEIEEAKKTALCHLGEASIAQLGKPRVALTHEQIEAEAQRINEIFRRAGINLRADEPTPFEASLIAQRTEAWRSAHIESGFLNLGAAEAKLNDLSGEERVQIAIGCRQLLEWGNFNLKRSGSARYPEEPEKTIRDRLRAFVHGHVLVLPNKPVTLLASCLTPDMRWDALGSNVVPLFPRANIS